MSTFFSSPEQVRLEQVVAMDVNFTLLTRVWCVAELVEADHLHISQVRGLLHIMFGNGSSNRTRTMPFAAAAQTWAWDGYGLVGLKGWVF